MNDQVGLVVDRGEAVVIAGAAGDVVAYLSLPTIKQGPGLLLLHDGHGPNSFWKGLADYLAEEGYSVLLPMFAGADKSFAYDAAGITAAEACVSSLDWEPAQARITQCLTWMTGQKAFSGDIAVMGHGIGGNLGLHIAAGFEVVAVIAYDPIDLGKAEAALSGDHVATVLHFADSVPVTLQAMAENDDQLSVFGYMGEAVGFACSERSEFNKPQAGMAYSRSLRLLREKMGPDYDLAALFDVHVLNEFVYRDVDATIATMVDEPYVNSVPVLTGGVGGDHLHRFYKYHFIPGNPADSRMVPISRTIGTDRLVDEFIFCFTHDQEVDYMLPGIAPTGKYVEIPMLVVVSFRGDKVFNEHIYWDQASVLVQVGLLERGDLPVTGIEQAQKLRDVTIPSNELMTGVWERSEADAAADKAQRDSELKKGEIN